MCILFGRREEDYMMYMRCGNRGKPSSILLEDHLTPFIPVPYASTSLFPEDVDNNWKDIERCSQYVG